MCVVDDSTSKVPKSVKKGKTHILAQQDGRPDLSCENPDLSIYDKWRSTCKEVKLTRAPGENGSWCRYCNYKVYKDELHGPNKLGLKPH